MTRQDSAGIWVRVLHLPIEVMHILSASVRNVLVEACSARELKISRISLFVESLGTLRGVWTDTSILPISSPQQWLIGLWKGSRTKADQSICGVGTPNQWAEEPQVGRTVGSGWRWWWWKGGWVSKEAGWQIGERPLGNREGGAAWSLLLLSFLQLGSSVDGAFTQWHLLSACFNARFRLFRCCDMSGNKNRQRFCSHRAYILVEESRQLQTTKQINIK